MPRSPMHKPKGPAITKRMVTVGSWLRIDNFIIVNGILFGYYFLDDFFFAGTSAKK